MVDLRVVSWDRNDASSDAEELNWWGGFFDRGMRWKDYLQEFDDDIHPYLEAARDSAVKNKVKVTGAEHQSEEVTPVFSDGRCFSLTFRAWGDFMAAVWSEAENQDRHYMDFYM